MAFAPDDVVLAARIKALAHPARLAIVRALARGDGRRCCCGDLVSALPLAQSTVSEHLRVLRSAGLIRGEIDGPRCCYRLDRDVLASMAEAMGAVAFPAGRREGAAA